MTDQGVLSKIRARPPSSSQATPPGQLAFDSVGEKVRNSNAGFLTPGAVPLDITRLTFAQRFKEYGAVIAPVLRRKTGALRLLRRNEGDPEDHDDVDRGFGSFGEIVSDLSLFGADERFMVTIPLSTGGAMSAGELVRAIKLGSFEDLAALAASWASASSMPRTGPPFGSLLLRWHNAAEIGVSLLRPADMVAEVLSRMPMMVATYLNNCQMAAKAQADARDPVRPHSCVAAH